LEQQRALEEQNNGRSSDSRTTWENQRKRKQAFASQRKSKKQKETNNNNTMDIDHPSATQLQQAANENAELVAQIRDLKEQLRVTQEAARVAAGSVPAPAPVSTQALACAPFKPTKILGELPEYHGERDTLEPWIGQATAKVNTDYVGCSDAVKFEVVANRLRNKALLQMSAWLASQRKGRTQSFSGLIEQLRVVFGDPHRKERALRNLVTLRQTNKSFTEYFVKFQTLLAEAGGSQWDDVIKKSYLERGISVELSSRMVGLTSLSQSFGEYVSKLQLVSDQLDAHTARAHASNWRRAAPIPTTVPIAASAPAVPDAMDWEPTPAARAATARPVANSGARAKWVAKEELDRRRSAGLCLRCGASGHRIKECPYQPARRPEVKVAAPTRVRTSQEIPPALEKEVKEEDIAFEDSGKA
jgi:hypothetical protein